MAISIPSLVFYLVLWKDLLKTPVYWNIPAAHLSGENSVHTAQRMSIWFQFSTTQTLHYTVNGNALNDLKARLFLLLDFLLYFKSVGIKFPVPHNKHLSIYSEHPNKLGTVILFLNTA